MGGPLALSACVNLLAVAITTGGTARRALGVTLALASMATPWLVPREHSLLRATWVLVTFGSAMRVIDMARGRWSFRARFIHSLSLVDTRRLRSARPEIDGRGLAEVSLWTLVGIFTYLAIPLASRWTGTAYWTARWSLALVFIYALSSAVYRAVMVAYLAFGFVTPRLHIAPAASRSVQEFWGERWNRIVSAWLSDTVLRPLARRRRPLWGAFAAFVVSAVFHAYLALVAVSWAMAWVMLAFFLLQAAIIALERTLRVRAWRPVAGHAWTLAWMVGLSPMFTEPALRGFGV